jgi:hypothetical protein
MDITPLREAFRELLEAAAKVDAAGLKAAAPDGEWDADRIVAHVSLITAGTASAVASVAAGSHAFYDNRLAQDTWTIDRLVARTGGGAELRKRLTLQADGLCALGEALGEAELDTQVPSLLVSKGEVMLDGLLSLHGILAGLADAELPGHTAQLLALTPPPPGS